MQPTRALLVVILLSCLSLFPSCSTQPPTDEKGGASPTGGRGTVFGSCLGALFMASLDNRMSLSNVPDFIQDIVKGGIVVTAVGLDMLARRREYIRKRAGTCISWA